MLDCEFVVVEGEHVKRKLWSHMVISGTEDGHAQAADITTRTLRAILECARGIKPTDVSEAAKKARDAEYDEFDGNRFLCKLGIEPAKEVDGRQFGARNILPPGAVITPDMKEWHPIEQQPKSAKSAGSDGNAPVPIKKPDWAKS
jgi:hypothetical protein